MLKPDYIIFPDGSVKLSGKTSYSGYGIVVLDTKTNKYITLAGELSKGSVPYCEVWAAYRGLQYVEHVRKKHRDLQVLVVSDSQVTVNSLSTWMKKSWDLSDPKDWKTSSGRSVANQKIYKNILKILSNKHYKVKFVHIRSHSDNKPHNIKTIAESFKKNGIEVDKDTLHVMLELNRLADMLATAQTEMQKAQDCDRMVWVHEYRLLEKGVESDEVP